MSIGKVTVWRMTEEQRQEYIKKHPIVPTKKQNEAQFNTDRIDYKAVGERKKESLKNRNFKRIIDGVNMEQVHEWFMAGKSIVEIADELKINRSTLNNYIRDLRKTEPEKWPYRSKK
jgi:response regulator of citrate/malate metabolism